MNPAAVSPQMAPAMRVYLVEDSPAVCERLQSMLADIAGTQAVGFAATAQEAIRGILAAQPDVVVLDLRLADGSGLDVLRALRRQGLERDAIDVYMLTNFAEEPYRRAAERLGVQGFFDKSTEFERVRDALVARARAVRPDRINGLQLH
ncbi:MAG TPA: response regulator [Burkholderiales bacterium]|nr:response regulator [Burkholderiales bacterium]